MDIRAAAGAMRRLPLGLGPRGFLPNLYDLIVFILIAGAFAAIAHGAHEMSASLKGLDVAPITLDPRNLPEYALRTTLRMFAAILLSLRVYLRGRDARGQEPQGRARHRPGARHPSISPGAGLSDVHGHLLPRAVSRQRARRRVRGDLRDLHRPGLEHDVQLLPIAAHDSVRSRRVLPALPAFAVVAVLAVGSPVRRPRPDLEYDDVDVGRLVLRCRLGGDHGRRHHRQPAGDRLLDRACDRSPKPRRGGAGGRHNGARDPRLRSVAVSADRRVGRQVQIRADRRPAAPEFLGLRSDTPHQTAAARGFAIGMGVRASVRRSHPGAQARNPTIACRSGARQRRRVVRARHCRHRLCAVADRELCAHHARSRTRYSPRLVSVCSRSRGSSS